MATDVERLIIRLEATQRAFEKQLASASNTADRRARQIESRFQRMNKSLNSSFVGLGRTMAGAFAGVAGIKAGKQLLDSATSIDNALKVAGLSGQELEHVYARLFASATKNAIPLETLVTLYGRVALAQKELGVSSEEVGNFTDSVALALRVAGSGSQAASGALLQLSQALGAGVVRAQEFNSILEGAPTIAQAVAAGLKEAGGSVATLRQLVVDGKVSSEAFFRAFEAGAPMLEEKVSGAVMTIDQRMGNLRTALVNAAREFNQSTEAGQFFGTEIDRVTDFVNGINFDSLISSIQKVIREFNAGVSSAQYFAQTVLGLENVGAAFTGGAAQKEFLWGSLKITSQKGVQNRVDGAFEGGVQVGSKLTADAIKDSYKRSGRAAPTAGFVPNKPPEIKPVSLSDFASPNSKDKKNSSTKERADEYERLAARIADSTAAMVAETEVQRGLNPLIDDYGYAVERARAEQDLLNAALDAGKEITPELRAQIGALAGQYATATVEAAKLAESQEEIRQKAQEMADFQKDLTRGIIDGFIQGKNAADIFADALKKVGDRLLNDVLDSIFQIKNASSGAGGIFGFLGNLFGIGGGISPMASSFIGGGGVGLFADGGYTGAGGKHQPKGVVHGGEYVFSKEATSRIGVGNLEAMHRSLKGYANGGLVAPSMPSLAGVGARSGGEQNTYAPQYSIDARGAEAGVEQKISAALREHSKSDFQRWVSQFQQAKKRNIA